MPDYCFIKETSNYQKLKVFFLSVLVAVVVIGAGIAVLTLYSEAITVSRPFRAIRGFVMQDISRFTPVGLFYLAFVGGLFFIPLPIEAFFFKGLLNGNPAMLSFFLVLAGILPSQAVDYFIGDRFSPVVMQFMSRKKVYKAKRWVNRYGPHAIFFFNVLPLPSPLLTFALGIAKYNPVRLYAFLVLGNIVKFGVIWGFFSLVM